MIKLKKKFESIYNKRTEIKNENLTFEILNNEEYLNIQELNSIIKTFKDLIKGFIEQINEPFNSELEEILNRIKKVTGFEDDTYIGDINDDKKMGLE